MPTYEYECTNCGSRVELMQRVGDPPLRRCGKCSGRMRKLLFPVGVIYKGSGFYTTDYARKSSSLDDDGDGKRDKKPDKKEPEPSKADAKG
jgi:putative FmdB family regulatory protein